MPPSIHASDSAELPGAVSLALGGRGAAPGRFAAAVRTPAGAVGLALTALAVLVALLAPLLAPSDPFLVVGPSLAAPSAAHPMGTDALGRDLASGVLLGARASLLVAAAVSLLALMIGTAVGMTSGYLGGRLDDILMRVTEMFQVLPRFFLAAVAIAMFGPGLDRLVLVLGLTSWPVLARVVRSEVLSLRRLEYVRAAVAYGASIPRILLREVLPGVMPSTLVMVGLLIGQVVLLEASLGFIGLGDPDVVSWGSLAGQAQGYLRVAWWMTLFPGLAITTTVLGLNLLADAVASALKGRW